MKLATLVWIYATVWFVYSTWFIIKQYRSGELKGFESKITAKIDDPEMIAHYEQNIHGIRTKMQLVVALLPILLAFMLGSVWPLIVVIRVGVELSNITHRHDK